MNDIHPFTRNAVLAEIFKPTRIVFIVNPQAGTHLQSRIKESVDSYLDHRKFEYGIWFTEHAGHATILTQKAIQEEYEIVVAVGGDGSINEVAAALVGSEVVLGIIPAGSGNGLAMHLGYGRNIDAAIKKLNTAKAQKMDCGLLNGRPFFNIAGIGFDGMVSNLMKGRKKRGFSTYFLKSMKAGLSYIPKVCTIIAGGKTISEKCFTISVANGPMYGYNFSIAPDAKLDDGEFEVVILKDAPKWKYFAAVPATLNGGIYDASFVEHFSASSVNIQCEGDNYVHLDGEGMIMSGELKFEMRHNALRILVPKV